MQYAIAISVDGQCLHNGELVSEMIEGEYPSAIDGSPIPYSQEWLVCYYCHEPVRPVTDADKDYE